MCNLCRCNDGAISCQKRKCGTDGLMRGTECSHTTCKLDDSGEHSLIIVQHSHRENFGRHHHCAYMPGATAIDKGPKLQRNCRCHVSATPSRRYCTALRVRSATATTVCAVR